MKFQYANGQSPLDGYIIRRGIGIGGFGEVYFAESDSGKEVALKRIQKNLDVEMRGVRHCLNLRHPNLVAIYDIRYDDQQQGWIVMEFIEGESLRDHLDRSTDASLGPIHAYDDGSPQKVLPVFAQIVAGVTYLHDQGIVHRDLKPANVFLEKGLAKIGDYGLSKYISSSRRAGQTESVGTFHYMAPEIGKGEYGKEIDIYSLGIILYEMLTGTVPFDGQSTQEILLKHLTADPDLSMLPTHLAQVIGKSLAKNPEARYRDGRDLLKDLGYELTAAGFVTPIPNGQSPAFSPSITNQPHSTKSSRVAKGSSPQNPSQAATNPSLTASQRLSAFFTIGIDGHRAMLRREPTAALLRTGLGNLVQAIGLPAKNRTGNWILALIAIAAMLSISGASKIIGYGLCAYAIYYCIWFFGYVTIDDLNGVSPKQATYPKDIQETADYPKATIHREGPRSIGDGARRYTKPMTTKEAKRIWKVQQQHALSQRNFWSFSHSWLQSMTFSGLVATVTSVAGGFIAVSEGPSRGLLGTEIWNQRSLGAIAWLGTMSILCSWTIVTFARRWESRQEDSIAFRFASLVAGLILGAISFQITEFLLVPWSSILEPSATFQTRILDFGLNRSLKGFYDQDRMPNLAGHMAYFAALMWIVRWWRQSESLRKKKFSIWAVVWSMLMAALVQSILFFPSPWCLWMAGIISLSVQIASPWIDPSEPRLAQVPYRPSNHDRT